MTMELGSVPDWIQAFGTLGAFGIAVGLYWREVKERERSQASLVSAWWSRVDPRGEDVGIGTAQPEEEVGFRLWIKNSSQEAIYDCFVVAQATAAEDVAGESRQIGRFAYLQGGEVVVSAGIVPPAESLQYFLDGEQIGGLGEVKVVFRDAQGRSWQRAQGTLERADRR